MNYVKSSFLSSSKSFENLILIMQIISSDTPTAKARWVLIYADFQVCSKAYKTGLFL